MRAKLLRKLKQNKAFTLAELLITVAVLTVLLGMAMIGLSEFSVTTKMTELDNYAKSIYLEAQNQLTAKKMQDGSASFHKDIATNYSDRFLQDKPSDYENSNEKWKQISYLTKVDDATKELIYVESDLYGKDFIIELNSQTGDIYGVFCWEAKVSETTDKTYYENYYNNVISKLSNRTKETRKAQKIGYYGGNFNDTKMSSDFELDQKVEIINEEELYVKVSIKYDDLLVVNSDDFETKCIISGNGVTREIVLPDPVAIPGNRYMETYLLLDSMQPGYDFNTIINNGVADDQKILPGSNLTISVTSKFTQGTHVCKEPSPEYIVNSMFGNSSVENDGTTTTTTIGINSLRHFRNLKSYEPEQDGVFVIQLMDDIDFATNKFAWKLNSDDKMLFAGENTGDRPDGLDTWLPLNNNSENKVLFENNTESTTDKTIVEGFGNKSYTLRNFYVESVENNGTGIFGFATNVHFKNLKIEDVIIDAADYDNVGALAGNIYGCTVENCGVYLTTYTRESGKKEYYSHRDTEEDGYKNEMELRCDTYKITGKGNVGGLFGLVQKTKLKQCYAAIQVEGTTNYIGGLIGNAANVTVENSYASGKVTGKTAHTVAGFIGAATQGITVTNAYATGDVWGNNIVGGFVGYSDSESSTCTYTDCYAYGEVLNASGEKPINVANAGGFIGYVERNNKFNSCKYLRQKGYNIEGNFKEPDGMSMAYSDFLVIATSDGTLTAGACYPYKDALLYGAFPFKKVLEHHYGDWAPQFVIDNALVYYEKYENGQYGYYSVTQMSGDGVTQETDGYTWVLDTLQDKECIEDGYALLSMYDLEKFDYKLMVGSADTNSKGESTVQTGTLVASDTHGVGKAVKLRQQGTLEFKAYNPPELEASETPQEHNYKQDGYVTYMDVSGMYVYQLPYELQSTYRYYVSNFYDKLILYNGYAKGNKETSVVGGDSVAKGLDFFYCPHFAKTAVNPGMDDEGQYVNASQLKNPATVTIRSARHLNALGRFPYFWNKKGGITERITYKQEVDVNFETYTTTYCGSPFDINTPGAKDRNDIVISNSPIGDPNIDDSYAQFKNIYDGQCNKIINYCTTSSKQFVGLFGEILGAKLENIVMVADEGKGSIVCEFDTYLGEEKDRAGAGALVGLAYKQDGVEDSQIKNCVSAGYTVEFVRNNAEIGRVAVGGLVGFSLTDIQNCAAVNDIRFVQGEDKKGNPINSENAKTFIGGLVGSFLYGTLENAYAGGNIEIVENGDSAGFFNVAGVTPGGMRIPGYDCVLKKGMLGAITDKTPGTEYTNTKFKNLYSYTTIHTKDKKINIKGDDTSYTVIAKGYNGEITDDFVAGSDYYIVSTAIGNLFKNGGGRYMGGDGQVINMGGTFEYCYYLQDTIIPKLYEGEKQYLFGIFGKITEYYVYPNNEFAKGDPMSYDDLSSLKNIPELENRAKATYPTSASLEGKNYPFPAVITDEKGNYVHYGDWPYQEVELPEPEPEPPVVEPEPEPPVEEDTSSEDNSGDDIHPEGLVPNSGFQIGTDDDSVKNVELYRTWDENTQSYTYSFEFKLTSSELKDEEHLYVVAPIPDLIDFDNVKKQVYLTFEDDGTCDATHSTDNPNKVKDAAEKLIANKTYVFYISGIKINPDTGKPYSGKWHDDNSRIKWTIRAK